MEWKPFMFLIWVWFKVKSQSAFKTMRIWDFMCLIPIMEIIHILWFKSNWKNEKTRIFWPFDPNHFLHMIQIIFFWSPLLDLIRIKYCTWFVSHNFSAFSSCVYCIWSKSIFCTWFESRGPWFESHFPPDSNQMENVQNYVFSFIPLHLFIWFKLWIALDLNLTDFLNHFQCLISSTYKTFLSSFIT